MLLPDLQRELVEAILTDDPIPAGVKPSVHLFIYQHTFFNHHRKILITIYPRTARLVEEAFFDTLVADYIKKYPARTPYWQEYGEYLAELLLDYSPAAGFPFLADLAKFEWAYWLVQHQSTRQLIQCDYPLLDIIEPRYPKYSEDSKKEKLYLLIMRRDLEIYTIKLTAADFAFLSAIQTQQSLSEATAAALAIDANFEVGKKLELFK